MQTPDEPITPSPDDEHAREVRLEAFFKEFDELSEAVTRAWKSELSAVEAVEEQKRKY
jgi:hypothetical protein